MTKDRKRKKYNSSVEEDSSFENSGKAKSMEKDTGEGEKEEARIEDSNRQTESLEKIGRRIERVIGEMDEARGRCNGKINGQLKSLIREIREDTEEVVRRAVGKETEAETLRKELESLRAASESLRKDFNEFVQAMKEKSGLEEFRKEMGEIRKLKEEMRSEIREMKGNRAEKGYRRQGFGAASTPLATGTAAIEMASEEDRIEEFREEEEEKKGTEKRKTVSYAEITGRNAKRIFGRRDAREITTTAVIEKIPDERIRDRPIGETPRPQRTGQRREDRGEGRAKSRSRSREDKVTDQRVETIRVKSQEAYPVLLRKIRTGADPTKSNVIVLSSKKETNGHLLLKVKGKEEDIKKYRIELAKCLEEETRVEKVQRLGYVHVCNLDSLTSEEEIASELCAAAEIGSEELKVTSLRPAYGESQKATVKLPKDAAVRLGKIGRVKIGLVACRVYVRSFEERCYKCGGTGHIANKCENMENVGRCFRCGKEGHFARECREETRRREQTETGKEQEKGKEGQDRENGEEPMQEEFFEVEVDAGKSK